MHTQRTSMWKGEDRFNESDRDSLADWVLLTRLFFVFSVFC